ncbi:UNC93-like protein MFSD11 [Caenorhabditis elegans]|nr:UNC93-like protein MFSD11 [Caenorhabditis elegans]CTQ86545.1 UNC93-like protein MFSD11 [Caenorhabditis elegans]|eukprot:NP_001300606.1 PLugged Excretory Pore [Caenorhabditis elegans]
MFPNRYILMVTSALGGAGATLLWVGQGQYITENISEANREKNTSIQWGFYKMSLIFGGVFFFFYFQNSSIDAIVANGQMQIFFIVFMTFTVLSIINSIFLPQSQVSQNQAILPFCETFVNSFKLLKTPRMFCFTIFFFYTGLIRSFWISIYPACIKFTSQLSTNTTAILTIGMIVTGCGQVIGSLSVAVIGNKIRKFGQHTLILCALILHIFLCVMISLTFPNDAPLGHTDKNGPVFGASVLSAMTISALLGFGDAILQTQVYSYIAKYYQNESSTVFSIFRFSSGIASTLLFFAAQYFHLMHHLILIAIFAVLSGLAVLRFQKSSAAVSEKQKAPITVIPTGKLGSLRSHSISPQPLV